MRLRKPVVSASILSFDGQISTFVPFEGPCYRCLYPTPPPAELAPSCSANGVLGVMAGTMGTLQANEVIKLVLGIGEPLIGRLLLYEALGTRFTELKVRRDPDCPICGENAAGDPGVGDGQVPRLRRLLRRRRRRPLDAGSTRIPPRWRPFAYPRCCARRRAAQPEVEAAGSDVGEVLRALTAEHPATAEQLFGEDGDLNRYVNVYLNDEDVRVLDGPRAPRSRTATRSSSCRPWPAVEVSLRNSSPL